MPKPRQIDLGSINGAVNGPGTNDTVLVNGLISEIDLLRLKTIARLHARSLPGVDGADLLHEAIARMLAGSRRKPPALSMVAFLAGVMRSIKSEHWRCVARESRAQVLLAAKAETGRDPERDLAAIQQLALIDRLFADDVRALKVLSGLGQGLSAEDIQKVHDMSQTEYDSTRKRIRRVLLREGLAWRQP